MTLLSIINGRDMTFFYNKTISNDIMDTFKKLIL